MLKTSIIPPSSIESCKSCAQKFIVRPWNFRFRSLLSRILQRSRIHGCRSLFRSCYFSADRKSAKGLRVAARSTSRRLSAWATSWRGIKTAKINSRNCRWSPTLCLLHAKWIFFSLDTYSPNRATCNSNLSKTFWN